MIELRDVYKAFGSQKVLRGVNFRAEEGEIAAIMGPSGEGKSVTLKHIIGLLKPDQGRVLVDGEDITDMGAKDLNRVRRKIGMLFQDAALFDDMNVLENVGFPLREHTKLSDGEIEDRVEETLAEVGLKDVNHKFPNELSGGMRKRVGLARALMLEPKILLFDEPTTGLDPIITAQIAELIEETHEKHNVTVVLISHDLYLSYRIADRIAMLYRGQIVEDTTPALLRSSEHPFVREFLQAQQTASDHA